MSTRVTGSGDFLIFGHRGSPRRFPENALASFEEALRAGADGFETDLRLLADDSAVLFHDHEVGGHVVETLDRGAVAREHGGLTDLAALTPLSGRGKIILEVKRHGWEERLLREVASWRDFVVASFDHRVIARLATLGASFPLGITTGDRMIDLDTYASRLGASWVFPHYRFVDTELVEALHAQSIRVVPWTSNRESEWLQLRRAGCDGVITDLPAEAVEWRRRQVAEETG